MTRDNEPARASRPVRVEDVARVAGVSPITVSRALSVPDKVTQETRRKVADAVAKTGYVVNSFASALRSGRSPIISVFASNLRNQHFAQAMQGCAEALEGSGFHLLMAQAGTTPGQQREVVDSVVPFRPAAMMFTDVLTDDATRMQVRAMGIPVVEMWDQRPDPIDMLVTVSEYEAGRLMGEHFGKRGYTRIAFAGLRASPASGRVQGFRDGLAAHGLNLDFELALDGRQAAAEGGQAFTAIRDALPDCRAIFFGTDILASGAMLEARRLGMRVPRDVAIAGFGDYDFAPNMEPPLTSVHVSGYELGLKAGEMLLGRLRRQAIAEKLVVFPVCLKARQSTASDA